MKFYSICFSLFLSLSQAHAARTSPTAMDPQLQEQDSVQNVYRLIEDEGQRRFTNNGVTSSCLSYRMENRSLLSERKGLVKGIALTMMRSMCRASSDPSRTAMVNSQRGSRHDVLNAFRNSSEKDIWVQGSVVSLPFALYESDGNIYEGVDTTASRNADSAEAGLFQTSRTVRYPGQSWWTATTSLEDQYRNNPNACMEDIFVEGLSNSRRVNVVGDGEGARFQHLLRTCPALAAEQVRVTMRHNRRHYGPLRVLFNRSQAVRLMNFCKPLFEKIYDYTVANQQTACAHVAMPGQEAPSTLVADANSLVTDDVAAAEPESASPIEAAQNESPRTLESFFSQ